MASFVTNHLEQYLPEYTLPLYVKEMITGRHPVRQMHGHTFMEIVLIHSGQGLHLAGKSAVEIRAGDLLLIHPGLSHGYDNVGSLGLINLIYDPDKLPLPVLDGSQMPLFHQFLTVHRALSPEAVARPLLNAETAPRTRLQPSRPELLRSGALHGDPYGPLPEQKCRDTARPGAISHR